MAKRTLFHDVFVEFWLRPPSVARLDSSFACFAPDAVNNGTTASVGAESTLGTVVVGGVTSVGNGRFYHISFTAAPAFSQTYTGNR